MTPYRRTTLALLTLFCAAILAGCAGTSNNTSTRTASKGGGYYKDDGPGANPPANIDSIADAVPRIETFARANSRPYVVFGKRYQPISDNDAFRQIGTASWYGKKFHGKKTANGETYDMYAMSAAHPTLPLPSYARVTRSGSDKSVIVRINDRGPFHSSRIIDLSYAAASRLGLIGQGSGKVIVEAISNEQIARGDFAKPSVRLAAANPGVARQSAPRIQTASIAEAKAAPARPKAPSMAGPINPDPLATSLDTLAATPGLDANTPDALTAIAMAGPGDRAQVDALSFTESEYASNDAASNVANNAQPTVIDGHIYLQFGAFSTSRSARQLANKLNQQIATVEPRSAHVAPSGELYRVQVGPYASRTAAVNAAVRIGNHTGVQPTIALR